ncbi:hypothetical protein ACP4OV_029345 [Aristida adscensionis]
MATASLVSVATGVMKPLLSKLTGLLEEEYAKFKGVRKQIRFLIDELSSMSATLEMLADEEHLNPEMKDWRDKLRDMSYDIEDCVDNFMARAGDGGPKGFKGLVRKMRNLKVHHKIGNEIEELKRRVMEASERHKRYTFVPLAHNSTTSSIDPRLPALYEDIKNLVAIDGPMKEIIDMLNMETKSSSTQVKVISIYGCGGLGKTTLANQVYGSIKRQYSCSAFVSVSQNPNMKKILRDIAEGVGFSGHKPDDDVKQLIDKLRDHLHGKRYLVVFDDIWYTKHWEIIGLALLNSNCGSRIITTTRHVNVAEFCSSQDGSVYRMKPLSWSDSKMLLFKRAFGSENQCYRHLEDVPDKILGKCGGLPLAIITISSMLRDKYAKSEWDRVLKAIGSALAKSKNADVERMTTILSLSYTAMPHHLRTCLLYLSLFPEDYVIDKKCLINRWIAEGFIQKELEQGLYETGEICFNELINRCLIQPINVKYDQAKACRVHDIILDYIKCKADEENFVTSLDAYENVYTSEYKVRRLSVSNHNRKNGTSVCVGLPVSHVRSLILFGTSAWASLGPFTVLRVLDCEGIEDHHIAGIDKLIHLKYLRLSSWSITELPERIGELQHLQTLDVRGSRIKELPLNITKLQLLSHLYVDRVVTFPSYLYVDRGVTFPEGMIEQLRRLEELSEYEVGSYEQGMSLQYFNKLTELRTLSIWWMLDLPYGSEGIRQSKDIQSSVGALLCARNLQNLHIKKSSENLFPLPLDSLHFTAPCSLRKLSLKDCFIYKVPNWMGSLGNLLLLKLHILCLRPEDVEILGTIPSLLFLKLTTMEGSKRKIVLHGSSGFRSLKSFSLRIWACGTSLEFEAGSMPKLEHLKLWFRAHKMECLNGASNFGIQHLSALNKVEVIIGGNCYSVSSLDSIVSCVASAIKAATETLVKRPTLSFRTDSHTLYCDQCVLRGYNKICGVELTEWLKIWHIQEEQTGECCSCSLRAEEEEQTKQVTNKELEEEIKQIQQLLAQNLEMKLAQLEQELAGARQQVGDPGTAALELERARWAEEQGRHAGEMLAAMDGHASDLTLRMLVDASLAHYDALFGAMSAAALRDPFAVLSSGGSWRASAKRSFLWIGGLRPSELLRILALPMEPLTEKQLMALLALQQAARRLEDALSRDMDKLLQQTLAEALTAVDDAPPPDGGGHAAARRQTASAMGRLDELAGLVVQAFHLRRLMLQQMRKILWVRQAARGLLELAGYCRRLRGLSSLWAARPREPE